MLEGLEQTYPSIEDLLKSNSAIFSNPVTTAPTKYRFLTTVPTSVDIGYLVNEVEQFFFFDLFSLKKIVAKEENEASVNW